MKLTSCAGCICRTRYTAVCNRSVTTIACPIRKWRAAGFSTYIISISRKHRPKCTGVSLKTCILIITLSRESVGIRVEYSITKSGYWSWRQCWRWCWRQCWRWCWRACRRNRGCRRGCRRNRGCRRECRRWCRRRC